MLMWLTGEEREGEQELFISLFIFNFFYLFFLPEERNADREDV